MTDRPIMMRYKLDRAYQLEEDIWWDSLVIAVMNVLGHQDSATVCDLGRQYWITTAGPQPRREVARILRKLAYKIQHDR